MRDIEQPAATLIDLARMEIRKTDKQPAYSALLPNLNLGPLIPIDGSIALDGTIEFKGRKEVDSMDSISMEEYGFMKIRSHMESAGIPIRGMD